MSRETPQKERKNIFDILKVNRDPSFRKETPGSKKGSKRKIRAKRKKSTDNHRDYRKRRCQDCGGRRVVRRGVGIYCGTFDGSGLMCFHKENVTRHIICKFSKL